MRKHTVIPLIKALVGSRMWGIHTPDSDYDYRSVVMTPTRERWFANTNHVRHVSPNDPNGDYATYELDHMVRLIALKGNPSAIEVVFGQRQYESEIVSDIRWIDMIDTSKVAKSILGLSKSQVKLVAKRPDRAGKAYSSVMVARHLQKTLSTEGKMTPLDGMTREIITKMRTDNDWALQNGQKYVDLVIADMEFEANRPSREANLDYAADLLTRIYQDEELEREIRDSARNPFG